jgi:hypothetical protein
MGWRIYKKQKTDIFRTKCLICNGSIIDGEQLLETTYHGYRQSQTNRFHLRCLSEKYKSKTLRGLIV